MEKICQYRLINYSKCTPLVGDADNGGGYTCVAAGDISEISVVVPQLCWESKIALKKKS